MMIGWFSSLVGLLVFLCLTLKSTNATDTILQGQTITHPNTIVSSSGKFELGFFSPGNTSKYYLGIWHTVSKQPIVWVANREYPFLSESSNLIVNSEGQLVISNGRMFYEVSNITTSRINNTTFARLLDSGNLVLLDQISLEILWQSFDYPTDTILPGMNLGHDPTYNKSWSLVSWRGLEDPAPGSFSLDYFYGYLLVGKGSQPYWNGSLDEFENRTSYESFLYGKYCYVTWGSVHTSGIMHMVLDAFGQLMIQSWSEDDQIWHTLSSSKCSYRRCGDFSVCNITSDKPCSCLRGFEPLSTNNSSEHQTSYQGCVRKTNLQCNDSVQNHGFYWMKYVDFPSDPGGFDVNSALSCKSACFRNCSCIAYAFDYKLGCLAWFNDLFDLKQLATNDSNGKNFYLKLPASELITEELIKSSTFYQLITLVDKVDS
ncbi:hypothetical protein PTKIN_Ptkin11bG0161000 [Pterospermum kingtungense]